MAEKMVRTQVYLPRTAYHELKARAQKQGFTLGVQIREALVDYLFRLNPRLGSEETSAPLDLTAMSAVIALANGEGMPDATENHDRYVYGDPHGESVESFEQSRHILRESSPAYRVQRRATRRPKKSNR